ncbi:MAG: amidohydrolase family protein [Candidatus Moduliflexus flocculans]|nr:amidohydrolase family protein [Candidatus Moduliflexus flocculans]
MSELASSGTKLVDLGGALVLPGFIDSHTHFLTGGFALRSLQLHEARSRKEFVTRVAAKARELGPGRWILDGNWDEERFSPPELPRREWIDAVTPDNPVCVSRIDLHTSLANTVALRLAGITGHTPSPPGGEIVKDPATGSRRASSKTRLRNWCWPRCPSRPLPRKSRPPRPRSATPPSAASRRSTTWPTRRASRSTRSWTAGAS